jgi:hypothetical protein
MEKHVNKVEMKKRKFFAITKSTAQRNRISSHQTKTHTYWHI